MNKEERSELKSAWDLATAESTDAIASWALASDAWRLTNVGRIVAWDAVRIAEASTDYEMGVACANYAARMAEEEATEKTEAAAWALASEAWARADAAYQRTSAARFTYCEGQYAWHLKRGTSKPEPKK